MSKRPSIGAVFDAALGQPAASARQVTDAISHQVAKSASQHSVKADEFQRATYYLRPDQVRAMKLRAVAEGRNLSELVREAFDAYLRPAELAGPKS